jgi:hypothetical protein
MILATHMIGWTKLEGGLALDAHTAPERKAEAASAIRTRFASIKASGTLTSRSLQPGWDHWLAPGRSFYFDDLAGDSQYVFLETESRYLEEAHPMCWGWQFDAERLIRDLGAVVNTGDLAGHYEDIIAAACAEVARTLPRLPAPDQEDLRAFLAEIGEENPAMLAAMEEDATDPFDALHGLICGMETPEAAYIPPEAVTRAKALIAERLADLQCRRRKTGEEALRLLRQPVNCEVLVRERLPLSYAVAEIHAGQIVPVTEGK